MNEHCWHRVDQGTALFEVCCWCNSQRIRAHRPPAGHGKFVPNLDGAGGEEYWAPATKFPVPDKCPQRGKT